MLRASSRSFRASSQRCKPLRAWARRVKALKLASSLFLALPGRGTKKYQKFQKMEENGGTWRKMEDSTSTWIGFEGTSCQKPYFCHRFAIKDEDFLCIVPFLKSSNAETIGMMPSGMGKHGHHGHGSLLPLAFRHNRVWQVLHQYSLERMDLFNLPTVPRLALWIYQVS